MTSPVILGVAPERIVSSVNGFVAFQFTNCNIIALGLYKINCWYHPGRQLYNSAGKFYIPVLWLHSFLPNSLVWSERSRSLRDFQNVSDFEIIECVYELLCQGSDIRFVTWAFIYPEMFTLWTRTCVRSKCVPLLQYGAKGHDYLFQRHLRLKAWVILCVRATGDLLYTQQRHCMQQNSMNEIEA